MAWAGEGDGAPVQVALVVRHDEEWNIGRRELPNVGEDVGTPAQLVSKTLCIKQDATNQSAA